MDDNEAFIRKHYAGIYHYMLVMLKDSAEAQDAVQETFYRYLRMEKRFGSEEEARAYLYRAALNVCKNIWRSNWFSKKVPVAEEGLLDRNNAAEEPDKEAAIDLIEAMKRIPVKYRDALHLYYYLGLSVSEIAALREKNEATVRTWLLRGRKLLRKEMGDDYEI